MVELGDGFAALAAQGFGLVQNGGNAALLGKRREYKWGRVNITLRDVGHGTTGAPRAFAEMRPDHRGAQSFDQVSRVY